jgi:hypothetical protein
MTMFDEKARKEIRNAPRIKRSDIAKAVAEAGDTNLDIAKLYAGVRKDSDDVAAINALISEIVKVRGVKQRQFDLIRKAADKARNEGGDVSLVGGVDLGLDYKAQILSALKSLSREDDPAKKDPTLFRHGYEIAEVVEIKEIGEATIDVLIQQEFQRALEQKIGFFKCNDEGQVIHHSAPKDLVSHLYHRRDLPLPYLERITRAPVFSEDGKLVVTPGYHRSARAFYAPPADLDVPTLPTRVSGEDLRKARQIIVEEWMGDIPFDGWTRDRLVSAALDGDVNNPPPASLLNAIGAALEQFVRPMIDGPLPPHLLTKPTERTGATLLATTIKLVAEGSESVQTLADDDTEREKRIVSTLRSGTAVNIFDNVRGEIDSPVLASFWTARVFEGRILAKSDNVRLPVTCSHLITGNNPRWSTELVARMGLIRIDARCAEPGKRTGFRHTDLPGWVRANRGKLIWALLVLIQNWIEKGKPAPVHTIHWGSYDAYVKVVGGIISAAAPNWSTWQTNRDQITADADSGEFDPFIQLFDAWLSEAGRDDAGLRKKMYTTDRTGRGTVAYEGLASIAQKHRISLPGVKRNPGGDAFDYSTTSLGTMLGSLKDRFFRLSDGVEYTLTRASQRDMYGYSWGLLTREEADVQKEVVAPKPTAEVAARRRRGNFGAPMQNDCEPLVQHVEHARDPQSQEKVQVFFTRSDHLHLTDEERRALKSGSLTHADKEALKATVQERKAAAAA